MTATAEGWGALTPEQTVRLLRAKASELESRVAVIDGTWTDLDYLTADLALVAGCLAVVIERLEAR